MCVIICVVRLYNTYLCLLYLYSMIESVLVKLVGIQSNFLLTNEIALLSDTIRNIIFY